MQNVAWVNQASLDHLPPQLQQLVDQLVTSFRHIYRDQLQAVYLNGSAVRGAWAPGHDIDIIAFVGDNAPVLEPSLPDSPDAPIDFLAITGSQRQHPTARTGYRLMILALDGLCVWGEPVDLTQAVPADPLAFASRLYFDFKDSHSRYLNTTPDDPRYQVRAKRMTKMIPRLANGIAIINGAPFTASYQDSLSNIEQWAPEWSERAASALALRHQVRYTDALYQRLTTDLGQLVSRAEALGVLFTDPSLDRT